MASLGATYDASQGEQMSDRSALPPGEYLAAIAKSDVGPTRKGDGGRKIDLEFEVLDGAHRGRRFWTTLNLWNPNPVAVEIAQRELNSICHAVGKLRVADTQELHAIPMKVTLGVDKAGRNVAKSYKPASGGTAAVPTSGAAETGRPRGPWA
jgi:Protein of unknown function (DUF669)